MSQTKFENIIQNFKNASSEDLMSMNGIRDRLSKEGLPAPTIQALSDWVKRNEQPKITNLSPILNNNGGIQSGIYYYPQVKQVVLKYYKKTVGRKSKSI